MTSLISWIAAREASRPATDRRFGFGTRGGLGLVAAFLLSSAGAEASCVDLILSPQPVKEGFSLSCTEVVESAIVAKVHLYCGKDSLVEGAAHTEHTGWWPTEQDAYFNVGGKIELAPSQTPNTSKAIKMPIPQSTCLGLGSKTIARHARIGLLPGCTASDPLGAHLFVTATIVCQDNLPAGVHVSTARIDDEQPDEPQSLPWFLARTNFTSSSELDLDPALGVRFSLLLAPFSPTGRWSMEVGASWQTFEGVVSTHDSPASDVKGDLFMLDLALLHRRPLSERLNVVALGGVGLGFVDGEVRGSTLSTPISTNVETWELSPLLGIGVEVALAARWRLGLRSIWRHVASPLDDASSTQLEVGFGYRLGSER